MNNPKVYLAGAIAMLVLAAGCEGNTVKDAGAGWTYISDGMGSAAIREITLPSGTRCAALIGYYKGALTCDWSAR